MQINVKGNNNIINVPESTNRLLEDQQATQSLRRIVRPVAEKDYDNLEFESQKGSKIEVTRKDAR